MTVDHEAAIACLLRLLAVPGVTGSEARIATEIQTALREAGVPAEAMQFDTAHQRIPLPTETGNLIVTLPGRGTLASAPRRLFMTHLDTVPLCAGAKPQRDGERITNANPASALGGDNRTGCAVLVSLIAELARSQVDHAPITLFFSVREESGLFGARYVQPESLGGAQMAFNFDGRDAAEVCIGAVGADRWEVDIHGRAAHAGVHPERGVSATLVLALALAEVHAGGWFGKVRKGEKEGTSNIGPVGDAQGRAAGEATNVVTDRVHAKGESRSHDAAFFPQITAAYRTAFEKAAAQVTDHEGRPATVHFQSRTDYLPFRLADDLPVVRMAGEAVQAIGRTPTFRVTNGGLDANWMCQHGIPTVTFGAGQNAIHTIDEWVDLKEFRHACTLAVTLATMA